MPSCVTDHGIVDDDPTVVICVAEDTLSEIGKRSVADRDTLGGIYFADVTAGGITEDTITDTVETTSIELNIFCGIDHAVCCLALIQ